MIGCPEAQTSKAKPADVPAIEPGTNTSFGSLKQIDAGVLNVGYAEAGPADGPAVILLHGWPYDIHSFVDVAPLLASAGYRVIVPHLRGHGTTRFLSSATFRNAQQSVVALDVIALMDALGIGKAILAGATARILTCSIRPDAAVQRLLRHCRNWIMRSGEFCSDRSAGNIIRRVSNPKSSPVGCDRRPYAGWRQLICPATPTVSSGRTGMSASIVWSITTRHFNSAVTRR
jgi:hypothetical protein